MIGRTSTFLVTPWIWGRAPCDQIFKETLCFWTGHSDYII